MNLSNRRLHRERVYPPVHLVTHRHWLPLKPGTPSEFTVLAPCAAVDRSSLANTSENRKPGTERSQYLVDFRCGRSVVQIRSHNERHLTKATEQLKLWMLSSSVAGEQHKERNWDLESTLNIVTL